MLLVLLMVLLLVLRPVVLLVLLPAVLLTGAPRGVRLAKSVVEGDPPRPMRFRCFQCGRMPLVPL